MTLRKINHNWKLNAYKKLHQSVTNNDVLTSEFGGHIDVFLIDFVLISSIISTRLILVSLNLYLRFNLYCRFMFAMSLFYIPYANILIIKKKLLYTYVLSLHSRLRP